jgi:TusA-related sulfurtransferase
LAGTVDKIIDFRESISSISLLKVTQAFEEMSTSEIMEIRGTDLDTRRDLFKVLPKAAYEIVRIVEAKVSGGVYTVKIRKIT